MYGLLLYWCCAVNSVQYSGQFHIDSIMIASPYASLVNISHSHSLTKQGLEGVRKIFTKPLLLLWIYHVSVHSDIKGANIPITGKSFRFYDSELKKKQE